MAPHAPLPAGGSLRGIALAALLAAAALPAVAPRTAAAASTTVYDAGQLQTALGAAQPGDEVVLAPGTYAGAFTATKPGLPASPILVRAQTPLGATLQGSLLVTGDYTTVAGLVLDGASVQIAADGGRLIGSRQQNTGGIAILISGGVDVEVAYNELAGLRERGISVRPNPRYPNGLLRPHIHHNYLHDFVGPTRANTREGIQIGQTKSHTNIGVGAILEYNLIERVSVDPEVISVKSSDNVVRSNTILASKAALSVRHGDRNEVSGNWIENSKGITLRDHGGRALGNRVTGKISALQVLAGDVAADGWPASGAYPAASGWLLAGNVADKTVIGAARASDTFPALNTGIAAHQGPISYVLQVGAAPVTTDATIPTASRLTAADVGPGAPGAQAAVRKASAAAKR